MYMVGIHKNIDVKLIKKRFRKLLINILIKLYIPISKIILHFNLLILNINGQWMWINDITSFWFILRVNKYYS